MKTKVLALAALGAALAAGSAQANVITYELSANATYVLAGVAHSGMIDITGLGDPALVTRTPMGGGQVFEYNSPSLSINLFGIGVATVLGAPYVFDLEHGTLAGFGTAEGGNFIYIRSALLDSYDLASTLAPVSGLFYAAPGSVATSRGQLTITSYNTGLFSARVAPGSLAASAAPEPATWTMLMAGFAGLGAALRTRRRALAAV